MRVENNGLKQFPNVRDVKGSNGVCDLLMGESLVQAIQSWNAMHPDGMLRKPEGVGRPNEFTVSVYHG